MHVVYVIDIKTSLPCTHSGTINFENVKVDITSSVTWYSYKGVNRQVLQFPNISVIFLS